MRPASAPSADSVIRRTGLGEANGELPADKESLIQAITERVMAELRGK
jgi:hypothetical protein